MYDPNFMYGGGGSSIKATSSNYGFHGQFGGMSYPTNNPTIYSYYTSSEVKSASSYLQ